MYNFWQNVTVFDWIDSWMVLNWCFRNWFPAIDTCQATFHHRVLIGGSRHWRSSIGGVSIIGHVSVTGGSGGTVQSTKFTSFEDIIISVWNHWLSMSESSLHYFVTHVLGLIRCLWYEDVNKVCINQFHCVMISRNKLMSHSIYIAYFWLVFLV